MEKRLFYCSILLIYVFLVRSSTTSSNLDTIYLEPYPSDDLPIHWERFATFVSKNKIPHVAVGILDLGVESYAQIWGVKMDSLIVSHFFKNLAGTETRISIHPFDGFGNAKWPFNYNGFTAITAVVHYIADMNALLRNNKINIQITGLVVGESMGGKPYQGNAATVTLFRNEAAKVGLSHLMIGAAAGDLEGMGLNALYKQRYDWTFYDSTNPNFWVTYAYNPAGFFKAISDSKVKAAWNTDATLPSPPWSELKNYYHSGLWDWQINPQDDRLANGVEFMFALTVPAKDSGDQPRLSAWGLDGTIAFYDYIKQDMKSYYKFALYMQDGLFPFH